jgi:copper transport protein
VPGRSGTFLLAVRLLVLVLAVLAVSAPGRAAAHAVLLQATPADGERLASAPARVELRFNEPVRLHALRLAGTGGIAAALVPEAGAADRIAARLPALGPGSYAVSWRLSSIDGHPVSGSIAFSVGPGSVDGADGAEEAVPVPAADAWGTLHAAGRAVAFAAGLTAAGALLFLALFGRQPAVDAAAVRRFALAATALATAAVMAVATAARAILDGGGPGSAVLARAADWTAAGPDPASALRLGGLALLALGAAVPRATVPAGVAGAVAVAASFGATGHTVAHAASADQPWLPALLAVHLLGVSFWIGALWPLLHAARTGDGPAVRPLMARFSAVALVAVPVLVLAGLIVAAALVGGWQALAATAYGRLLCAKILLVGGMLALAAANRWRLVPALASDRRALPRLRRSIGAEIVLALGVFAATAAMTSVNPPPRPIGEVTATASTGPLALALTVSPGLPGTNEVVVRITGADGAPFDPQQATLRLSSPGLGIEEIVRPMDRTGPGTFRHEGPELALAGHWLAAVDLLIDDFERRRVEFPIALGVQERHAH